MSNELAILCNRMGINTWEVIEVAKSKPYGFNAFYPGPGIGGHCIPLDPYYLSWKAREYGFHTSMIEASMMINDRMPEYCVERASKILNRFSKSLNKAKILLLGVSYKQDIDDYRESAAIKIIDELMKYGSEVMFYDSYVPQIHNNGRVIEGEKSLTKELLTRCDLVIITTAHSNIDYELVQKYSRAVFDTKKCYEKYSNKR